MPTKRTYDKRLSRRYNLEFFWTALVVCAVTALSVYFVNFTAVNNILYDNALRLIKHKSADSQILLVVIDDKSLKEIGPWPWRRFMHAQLLEQLSEAKVVGFDISFLDQSPQPSDDQAFTNAMFSHGRVVLSNFYQNISINEPTNPYPPFANAAREMGFINVPIDSDGLVRRMGLSLDFCCHNRSLHFSLAMLKATDQDVLIEKVLDNSPANYRLIPFTGPPNHYQTVSYSDILNRRIDPKIFNDKYIIVGAWATGLGDKFPTPTSTDSLNMSGVEILANALQADLHNSWIKVADNNITLVFCLAWVITYLVLLLFLPPRSILLAGILLTVSAVTMSILILGYYETWIKTTPALLGLLLIYPLWSWRMQEFVVRQMDHEIDRLNQEQPLFSMEVASVPNQNPSRHELHSFDVHLSELHFALDRVRNLRLFISNSLNSMPYATAVFDNRAFLTFSSKMAERYFKRLNQPLLRNSTLQEFLSTIINDPETLRHVIRHLMNLRMANDQQQVRLNERLKEIEFKDRLGNDVLLKYTNTYTQGDELSGFIITLIDITPIREEERRREETIRFISHDMRAPQSAIQALIKLQQNPDTALSKEEFLVKIAHLSNDTLNLVDNFLYLARSENAEYKTVALNLTDILSNAINTFWSISKERNIRIIFEPQENVCFVEADEALLTRALSNLIDNAIKYGRDGMQIRIDIMRDEQQWLISIQDQGIGIARKDFDLLFNAFSRVQATGTKSVDGMGLGLAFVHTVITRHHGKISLESHEGVGTTFNIHLPILEEGKG